MFLSLVMLNGTGEKIIKADGNYQWVSVSKGLYDYGSSVFSLTIDPLNSNIIYAGTYSGGVFKSTDGGAN